MNADKTQADQVVSTQVRALMARKGLTQVEVAEAVNLTQSGLSRTLSGGRQWRVDELVRLSQVLKVTVDDLVAP